jgi:uncharacterized protein (TIGR03663 family)
MLAPSNEKSTRGIVITGTTILLLVIFGFGIGMRLINLGHWAYHHDESIHAWYSYRLYHYGRFDDGGTHIYRYDPTYHGPFLYHIGALFFTLFGDNDFTGRLPFAAFGILMMILAYQLHHLIGKPRAILAVLFVAISPGLTYFARFARNDIYFATETLAIILFALLYFRDRRMLWLGLLAASFALLYATKENSYVTGFILCSFLIGYILFRTFQLRWFVLLAYSAAVLVFMKRGLFIGELFLWGPLVLFVLGRLAWQYTFAKDWKQDFQEAAKRAWSRWFIGYVILVIGLALVYTIAKKNLDPGVFTANFHGITVPNLVFLGFNFLFIAAVLWLLFAHLMHEDWKQVWRSVFIDYFELTALIGLYGILSVFVFLYLAIPLETLKDELIMAAERSTAKSITQPMARNAFSGYIHENPGFQPMVKTLAIWSAVVFMLVINFIRALIQALGERPQEQPPSNEGQVQPGPLKRFFLTTLGMEKALAAITRSLERHTRVKKIITWITTLLKKACIWIWTLFRTALIGNLNSHLRLVLMLAIVYGIYVFLFTTMFSNRAGLTDGLTDYVRYWYAQKFKPRIAQPELGLYYYVYFFLIYDLAAFLLVAWSTVYYGMRIVLRANAGYVRNQLSRPVPDKEGLRLTRPVFLSLWTLVMLVAYVIFRQRIPWSAIVPYTLPTVPAAVVAGYFLFRSLDKRLHQISLICWTAAVLAMYALLHKWVPLGYSLRFILPTLPAVIVVGYLLYCFVDARLSQPVPEKREPALAAPILLSLWTLVLLVFYFVFRELIPWSATAPYSVPMLPVAVLGGYFAFRWVDTRADRIILIAWTLVVLVIYAILHVWFPWRYAFRYILPSLPVAIVVGYFLFSFLDNKAAQPTAEGSEPSLALPIFLGFWALGVLAMYSILHERVPWLYTHQALPAAILAGYFLGEIYLRLRRNRWVWVPVAVLVGFVALFSARANILLNLYRGDDPREVMVYVQSSKTIRNLVKEIEQVAYKAGTYEDTSIGVRGSAQWPLSWYLRHYRSIPQGRDKRYPINIVDPGEHETTQRVLGEEFEFKKYRFRDHWSPDYSERTLGSKFSRKWWRNQLQYFFHRTPWSPVGGAELYLYRKRQLREIPKVVECLPGFDAPPAPRALVTSWGTQGSGPGQFQKPHGLAVSSDGHLYVVDSLNSRIQKFTLDGEFVLQFGGPTTDTRLETGKFVSSYGGPRGVACDSEGFVYVADTWGYRIQKFTPEGEYVTEWVAGPPGKFFGPRDVTVDSENRIYVADTGNERILVYDSEGRFLNQQIGRDGAAPGEFVEPVGIDILGDKLYVADVGNKRIQLLGTDGKFQREWALCGWETDHYTLIEPYLAVANDGTVYVTDSVRHCVYQFPADARSVKVWGFKGRGAGQLWEPTGIAVDGEGFVYVADTGNNRINKYQKPQE